MSTDSLLRALHHHLFADPGRKAYAILDGCQIEDLPAWLKSSQVVCTCLFDGPLDPVLEAAAPQIVALAHDQPMTDAILREGWYKQWGVILLTPARVDISALRQHLRSLLMVELPGGRHALFRFYDPRAFKAVMPHLSSLQRNALFGPVSAWLMEGDERDTALCFEPGQRAEGRELRLFQ
ncbi:DUF4123 domain-containing protein [Pseudomonas putida]